MKKRGVLSVVLVIVMMISLAMSGCKAYSDVEWKFEDGELVFNGKGDIKYVIDGWNKHDDEVKKIVIEDGVTGIGKYCFENFSVLEEVVIPSSVRTVDEGAFAGCTALKTVSIESGEGEVSIHEDAFPESTEINYSGAVLPDESEAESEADTVIETEAESEPAWEETAEDTTAAEETAEEEAPAEEESTATAEGVSSISIQSHPTKTTYYTGERLQTNGLRLRVEYDDGTFAIVSTGYSCYPGTLNKAGNQTVTVSFGGCSASFTVTVKTLTLTAISIYSKPSKVSYTVGESLNTSGLVITAYYSNGSTSRISSGFSCNPTKFTSAGYKTVTVSYGGKTTSFTVGVEEAKLTSISIVSKPKTLTYNKGDKLNTTGLTLKATYSDGSSKTVTSGFTCSPTTLNSAGSQKITVSYGGKTTSFTVTVNELKIIGISVSTLPTKNIYEVGEYLDTKGMKLTVNYSDGSFTTVTSGFTCSPTRFEGSGTQIVQVTYQGVSTTFKVVVNAPQIKSLRIKTLPTKTVYSVGERLNPGGFVLEAVYPDGSTERVYNGYVFSPSVFTTIGSQTVTVTYNGLQTSFRVTVNSANN